MKDLILKQGYCILENFFDTSKFNIIETIYNNMEKISILKGDLNYRYINLLGSDPLFTNLILDTGILDIAHNILCEVVNLSDYQALTLLSGAPSINPHIDYPYLLMDKVFVEPIASLQTLWILDDFTVDNGATKIAPYSHLDCKWPDESFEERSQQLIVKKGSVIVFHGAMWHSTAPNNSQNNRSTLLMSFCPPWIKPLTVMDKNIDKQNLSPKIKELLGYDNIKFINKSLKNKQNQVYNLHK